MSIFSFFSRIEIRFNYARPNKTFEETFLGNLHAADPYGFAATALHSEEIQPPYFELTHLPTKEQQGRRKVHSVNAVVKPESVGNTQALALAGLALCGQVEAPVNLLIGNEIVPITLDQKQKYGLRGAPDCSVIANQAKTQVIQGIEGALVAVSQRFIDKTLLSQNIPA
ncbi:MAG: hypothetical protein AB7E52_03730 [Bdellovibrionales bacterium]